MRCSPDSLRLLSILALSGVAVVASACDPGEPGGGGNETGTTGDQGGATTTSGGNSSEASSSEASSTNDTGSQQPLGPCAELSIEECEDAEACMDVEALWASDSNACDVGWFGQRLCVEKGEPLGASKTTFYAEIDGEMRFLINGQGCAFQGISYVPATWTECTDSPGEPEQCHCLCGANGCPTAAPMLALDACEVEAPCGEVVEHPFGEPLGDYATCVLESLRDRSPGYFPFVMEDVLFLEQTRVYATGDDQVVMVRRHQGDTCGGALDGTWRPAMQCTLQPPAFFEDCLLSTLDQQCLFGSAWFTDCEEVEPACP